MAKTRPQLQAMLNELEAATPLLQKQYPDPASFWPEFAAAAEAIEDAAAPDDEDWVHERIEALLRHHELAPPAGLV